MNHKWDTCHKIVLSNLSTEELSNVEHISRKNVNKPTVFGSSPLHLAVLGSNIKLVESLIEKKAKIISMNDFDETPLHWSSKAGNIEITNLLLKNNAIISFDSCNNTPFHWAAEYNNVDILELFSIFAFKTNLYLKNSDNHSVIDVACYWNSVDVVKYLLPFYSNVKKPLKISIKHDYIDVVKIILEYIYFNTSSLFSIPIISLSIKYNAFSTFEYLLTISRQDLDKVDINNKKPLDYASSVKKREKFQQIIENMRE